MNQQTYKSVIQQNPYYNFTGKPMVQTFSRRAEAGKEDMFYLLCGVLLFFALIKLIFGKYLHTLFAFSFRVSLKQKQLREQLIQATFPAFLLNFFFIISGGIYIAFLLSDHQVLEGQNFWTLVLYAAGALGAIYLVKSLVLRLTGWIFNASEATGAYIFIVFLINKLIGIFLLPVIILLAFSDATVGRVVIVISYMVLIFLFIYRYTLSYSVVRKEIKVSPFHFFLYLCAFELIPLILIYKVLERIL